MEALHRKDECSASNWAKIILTVLCEKVTEREREKGRGQTTEFFMSEMNKNQGSGERERERGWGGFRIE